MKQYRSVPPAEMLGYRRPTEEEKSKIYKFIIKELNSRKKQLRIFSIVFGCFFASFLISLVEALSGGELLIAEVFFTGVFVVIFAMVFIYIQKNSVRNKRLRSCFFTGDYEVMDCTPNDVYTNLDNTAKGAVHVVNSKGQVCIDGYRIDIQTAREYEKGQECKLLLIFQRNNDYSRVLTKHMLGE